LRQDGSKQILWQSRLVAPDPSLVADFIARCPTTGSQRSGITSRAALAHGGVVAERPVQVGADVQLQDHALALKTGREVALTGSPTENSAGSDAPVTLPSVLLLRVRRSSRCSPRSDVAVVDVKTAGIRAWVSKMVTGEVGAPTIQNAFGLLRQVLGAAVEDSRIPRNPCDGVPLPKRQHADRGYLSHAQVAALADAVERQGEVVRFLSYTGLRWGEMAALRVQDFDMLRRRVNVSRSVTESGGLVWSTPKTWERRSVPFPAVLCDELAALMVGKGREDLVFTDQRVGVLRNSNWRARVFRPAVAKCQATDETFPTITPHDLRHTAASLAVSAHANVKAVQRMLGHAKASMTLDVYADLFDEDLDGVADRLDSAIRSTADQLRTGRSQTR
jgi:integrase